MLLCGESDLAWMVARPPVAHLVTSINNIDRVLWVKLTVKRMKLTNHFSLERLETRQLLAGVRAEYFDNQTLSGTGVVRADPNINFTWGTAAPVPSINVDSFSVRWEATLSPLYSQVYTFYTRSDDGVRLWVNGSLVIDNWTPHPVTENSANVTLSSTQQYDLRMEYFDQTADATAQLLWSSGSQLKQVIDTSRLSPPTRRFDAHAATTVATSSTTLVSQGMQVWAETAAEGTFRLSAVPTTNASTTSAVHIAGNNGAIFKFDPASQQLQIFNGTTLKWSAQIKPLSTFGRAGSPGSQVAWAASSGEILFGLGERYDALNQWGRQIDLWNEDIPGQGDGSHSYFTTPVLFSNRGYAFYATDNPEGTVDLNSTNSGLNTYQRGSRVAQFYVSVSDSLATLIKTRAAIQGLPTAVPDWYFGPWISKNSYETEDEAIAAIQGSLDRGIPLSAIVQEAWKGVSADGNWNNFSTQRWPDLAGYFNYTAAHQIKTILWQVPVIDPASPEYAVGVANNYFVRRPDGSISLRDGWFAGWANVDFTNPAAVTWWQEMVRPEVRLGVAGFKADDGESIKPDDVFFDGRRGSEMHNAYSELYTQALNQLIEQERGNDAVIFSRSASLSSAATSTIWAGDQEAVWSSLHRLVNAGLSASISGQPFWGSDIGGYYGTLTPELYIRWSQLGALSPFMQYHGESGREPWLFGTQAERAYKALALLRMNLQPTLIALGSEASTTGMPIMRPMALQYPGDTRFAYEDQQYMLGQDLLVAPVFQQGATSRTVRFPVGRWIQATTGRIYSGGNDITVPIGLEESPLFLREGASLQISLVPGASLSEWTPNAPTQLVTVGAPRVIESHFDPTQALAVEFSFDKAVAASSLNTSDLKIVNLTTGQSFTAVRVVPSPDYTSVSFSLPSNMSNGNYRFTLASGSVMSQVGWPTETAAELSDSTTFVLAGDITRDRQVNFDDLLVIAQNYAQSGRSYSQGDLTYNGVVDFSDLLILAQNYGRTLSVSLPLSPVTPGRRRIAVDILS